MPAKLAQLKDMFWIEAAKNDVLPIGGGLWVPDFHPELRMSRSRPCGSSAPITRIPEFCAPRTAQEQPGHHRGQRGQNASGVLYKLGGAAAA